MRRAGVLPHVFISADFQKLLQLCRCDPVQLIQNFRLKAQKKNIIRHNTHSQQAYHFLHKHRHTHTDTPYNSLHKHTQIMHTMSYTTQLQLTHKFHIQTQAPHTHTRTSVQCYLSGAVVIDAVLVSCVFDFLWNAFDELFNFLEDKHYDVKH